MAYATEHADALDDVRAAGAPVTFTRTVHASYDPEGAAEDAEPTTTTVTGYAMRVRGRPDRYDRLTLIESQAPTLLFVPSTYGELPPLDAECTWGGKSMVVADVDPLEPDGTAILARVIVKRGGAA